MQWKKKEESVWVKRRPSRSHSSQVKKNEKWVERRQAGLVKPKRKRARETKEESKSRKSVHGATAGQKKNTEQEKERQTISCDSRIISSRTSSW